MVALNDKFSIAPYSATEDKNQSAKLNSKVFWDRVCEKNPSRKECLFYCD